MRLARIRSAVFLTFIHSSMCKNCFKTELRALFFGLLLLLSYSEIFPSNLPESVNDKIDMQTQLFLDNLPSDSVCSFWIFFKDKGLGGQDSYQKALEKVIHQFPERTFRRRSSRGGRTVDFYDLPVCQLYVDSIRAAGVEIKTITRWLNGVSVLASKGDIEKITGFDFVSKIQKAVTFYRGLPEINTEVIPQYERGSIPGLLDYGPSYPQLLQIHVPELHELGFSGRGIRIGMLDTGYDLYHQAFQHLLDSNRIIATYDFINGDSDVVDEPDIQRSHGTYTLSALAGYVPGTLIGPAFNSEYVLAKTEIESQEIIQEEYNWVQGIEWSESLGVDIVTSSLGYNDWYTYDDLDGNTAVATVAADIAVSKGVVVVNAAGNERNKSWHYIIAPADGDSVIAVGAVNLNGTISSFSSAGFPWDFQNGKIKPDVCACGVGTYCALPGGNYGGVDGTSLSTPLVAGACALVLEADTNLTPVELRERLWNTAYGVSSPDTLYGYGIVNAAKAAGYDYVLVENKKKILAFPNPFKDYLYIYVEAPRTSEVQFSIFNMAGEKVLKRGSSLYDGERFVFFWEGRNEKHQEVASGVYLVKVDIDKDSELIKVFRNR